MENRDMSWRKSTYSNGGANACVEVGKDSAILVRDTTNRDGGTLAFSTEAWGKFTATLRLAARVYRTGPLCYLSSHPGPGRPAPDPAR